MVVYFADSNPPTKNPLIHLDLTVTPSCKDVTLTVHETILEDPYLGSIVQNINDLAKTISLSETHITKVDPANPPAICTLAY